MPEVDLNVTYCRAVEYHDELMRFKRNIRTRLRFVAMNYCVPTPSPSKSAIAKLAECTTAS